ncbi:glycosyltransferase [Halosimplex aquaticum]|uniref:Glycosyltransferase n=1 Tax=Halosimplex aquaticum TaxID=3026162 RepID=A0ABD5Y922_9EURY|nr:glycosyltransferase [Halosimplex aquaticum]
MSATVGIVVPAFRPDVDRLASYVRSLDAELDPETIRIELDDAEERVATALADLPATVSVSPYRRGKGAAITAGFESLETDVLGFVDADGSTAPEEFADVLAAITDGAADVAVGSRRHPDSEITSHQTFARRFLGDGFAWLARRMLDADLYDYQCGAKAITAESWDAVRQHLYEPGFAWDVELVAMAGALELDVAEVPITWEDQPGSTVSPVRTSVRLGRALVSSRHRAKQIRNSRVHNAIAATREDPTALVERND